MITEEEIMPLLLKAAPSFRSWWAEQWADHYVSSEDFDTDANVIEFVIFLGDQLQKGETREFADVFDLIDRMFLEGDPVVREAAHSEILEGLHGANAELFSQWLRPEARRHWSEFRKSWLDEFHPKKEPRRRIHRHPPKR